jgi:hypothetical protein
MCVDVGTREISKTEFDQLRNKLQKFPERMAQLGGGSIALFLILAQTDAPANFISETHVTCFCKRGGATRYIGCGSPFARALSSKDRLDV